MFPKTMRGHMLRILYETLDSNGWNKSKTARSLQISLTTIKIMIREMKSFGVVPKVSHSCNPRLLKGRDGKFIGLRHESI
jgi:predicted transcriptional regulator